MIPVVTKSKRSKVSFYTFGCRLNQSETAVITRSLEKEGYEVVGIDHPADIVVINTCTVTENGDQDTRRLVQKLSRKNPNSKIALVGCQAQIQKEKLIELPNVHWVIGNEKKMDLPSIFNEMTDTPQVIAPPISRGSFTMPMAAIDPHHTRANLKIQDGCDFFCSFCEIPYARGRARSRVFDDVLLEARTLVAAGHKEVVLTGINVGTYSDDGKEFMAVIDALENLDGLKRLRISSIEPTTIPLGLFDRMSKEGTVCRYLHIPIQSGEDYVLERMKRKYSVAEFSRFIEKVYAQVPEIGIGTDVIVGFPGETDERFEQTHSLLKSLPFAYFHVFSYSERYYAKSQHFDDPVAPEKIKERSRILRELSQRKRRLFYETLCGTEQSVLVEEHKDGFWTGLTDNYVRVRVKSSENLQNQFLKFSLKDFDHNGFLVQ